MTVTNTDISELAIVMTTGHSPAGHEIEREVWLCIDHSGESRDQKWGYRLCVLRWPVVLRLANYSFFLSPSALLCSSYLKIEKEKKKKDEEAVYNGIRSTETALSVFAFSAILSPATGDWQLNLAFQLHYLGKLTSWIFF